jgi:hypothetical protein
MSSKDPFTSHKALLAIVKTMEKRWGLSLVSFLPVDAQEVIVRVQAEIAKTTDVSAGTKEKAAPFLEFYDRRHLHSTHLTLTRSDPCGPVRADRFVKPGHDLYELFEAIRRIASQVEPIQVRLDSLEMTYDGIGFLLLGRCEGKESGRQRTLLLQTLNQVLPRAFHLSRRAWDTDSDKYHSLGCRIGFLKRPPPQGYAAFIKAMGAISFEPVTFSLKCITLVHHRYRTLAFPQQGGFDFPLGQYIEADKGEFAREIDLV